MLQTIEISVPKYTSAEIKMRGSDTRKLILHVQEPLYSYFTV